jgi:hypothetical protein
MDKTKIVRVAAVLAMAATLTACATPKSPFPVPEEAGLYAVTSNGDLRRLDGNADWENTTWPERSSLTPAVKFVVVDPSLASNPKSAASRIELWRVAWVRSEIGTNRMVMPVSGSAWALARLDPYRIPFTTERAPHNPHALLVVPTHPLPSGLYAFRVNGTGISKEARLGVLWNSVDKRQYSAANCVDRYLGPTATYQSCNGRGAAQQASVKKAATPHIYSNQGMTITLAKPQKNDNGILVQGTVVNTTAQTKSMPLLQVTLQNASGQEVQRSIIQPNVPQLAPGERLIFKTQMANGNGATKVNVKFMSDPTTVL